MIQEYKQQFLNYLQWEKNYSSHTLTAYAYDIEEFLFFIEIKQTSFDELTPTMVSLWLDSLDREGVSARSLARKLSSLRSFYQYLLKKKYITQNPFQLFTAPKTIKSIPKTLSVKEMWDWLQAIPQDNLKGRRDFTILLLLYATGIRSQELCFLRLKDVLLSQKKIRVFGKGKKERIVPLLPYVVDILQQYLAERSEWLKKEENDFVFLNSYGLPIQTRSIREIIDSYSETSSKMHPHAFRYTFATHLLDNGVNLRHIQELLGHARLSVTERYTAISIKSLKDKFKQFHPHA